MNSARTHYKASNTPKPKPSSLIPPSSRCQTECYALAMQCLLSLPLQMTLQMSRQFPGSMENNNKALSSQHCKFKSSLLGFSGLQERVGMFKVVFSFFRGSHSASSCWNVLASFFLKVTVPPALAVMGIVEATCVCLQIYTAWSHIVMRIRC